MAQRGDRQGLNTWPFLLFFLAGLVGGIAWTVARDGVGGPLLLLGSALALIAVQVISYWSARRRARP